MYSAFLTLVKKNVDLTSSSFLAWNPLLEFAEAAPLIARNNLLWFEAVLFVLTVPKEAEASRPLDLR